MKKMKIILPVIGAILISVALLFSYYGLFAEIEFSEKKLGPFWLVYEKHVGDYQVTNENMHRIYNEILNNYSIKPTSKFIMYYDDLKFAPKDKFRSMGGCIIGVKDVNKEQIKLLKTKYKVQMFPRLTNTVCEFPFKGSISTLIAKHKVYPKFMEHVVRGGYRRIPITQIYDVVNEKIIFTAQTGFFPTFRMMR